MIKLKMVINARIEIEFSQRDLEAYANMSLADKREHIEMMKEETKNYFKANIDTEAKIISEHVDVVFEAENE